MKFILKLTVTPLIAISITACSTQQLYESVQDIRCQEYYKYEDPLHETQCTRESYDEYKRKRDEALTEKRVIKESK